MFSAAARAARVFIVVIAVSALASPVVLAEASPLKLSVTVKYASGSTSARKKVARFAALAIGGLGEVLVVEDGESADADLEVRVIRLKKRGRWEYRVSASVREVGSGEVLGTASAKLPRSLPSSEKVQSVTSAAVEGYREAREAREAVSGRGDSVVGEGGESGETSAEEGSSTGDGDEAVAGHDGETLGEAGAGPGGGFNDEWETKELSFERVGDTPMGSKIVTTTSGTVVVDHFRYFHEREVAAGPAAPGAGAAQDGDGRDAVEFLLESKASVDTAMALSRISLRRDFSDPERDRVDLVEGFVSVTKPAKSLRAGRLIESWGTASLHNPADILNPRDLRDPLDQEKLGAWMLELGWLSGPWHIQAYYLPIPEPHLLPSLDGIAPDGSLISNSRWISGTLAAPDASTPISYRLGNLESRQPTFGNAQGALRASATGTGFDLAVSYAYLFDHFSTVTAVVPNPAVPTTVELEFSYQRQHVVAVEAETTIGKLRLAGEAAAFFPVVDDGEPAPAMATEMDGSFVSGTVGADYRTAEFNGDHSVQFFVELTATEGWSEALADDPLARLQHPLRRALLARVEYTAGADLQVRIDAAESLREYGLLLEPALIYRVSSMVRGEFGISWLDGDEGGFFGDQSGNSRVSLRLTGSY